MWTVEGEHARFDGRQGHTTAEASEAFTHPNRFGRFVGCDNIDQEEAVAELECELYGIGDAGFCVIADDDAIDHHVEVVRASALENDVIAQVDRFAVHASAHEALPPQTVQLDLELASTRTTDGGEDRRAGVFAEIEDPIDDLLYCLRFDGRVTLRAVGDPGSCVQKAKVIGDFGDRADRRAWIFGEGALFDRDGR